MLSSRHFRVYYSGNSETWVEEIEAGVLAEATGQAEALRSLWPEARYWEIWQGAILIATSEYHPAGVGATDR